MKSDQFAKEQCAKWISGKCDNGKPCKLSEGATCLYFEECVLPICSMSKEKADRYGKARAEYFASKAKYALRVIHEVR